MVSGEPYVPTTHSLLFQKLEIFLLPFLVLDYWSWHSVWSIVSLKFHWPFLQGGLQDPYTNFISCRECCNIQVWIWTLLKKCINVIWINFVTQGNNSYGFLLVPVTALYRYWRWNILENILIELFGPIALVLNFHDSYWLSLFNFWSFLPLMWLKTF